MPLGNGDVGANVWTEPSGDVVLLISKKDTSSENGHLIKIGQVRLQLSPNPLLERPTFNRHSMCAAVIFRFTLIPENRPTSGSMQTIQWSMLSSRPREFSGTASYCL